ncbi:hypothetical protein [Pseudomonas aeruginosa]|uniref:hypothetical protein n=1 Tax=Pseudomonas aeruginosa TaxID=287 RepID=UPI000447DBCC|nr:hypothetical protein [Pseudomonas aeruginosa]KAJ15354.1 hypothetical protein M003_31030 [Pseudomonas aeruginosa IGB83]
MSNIRNLQWNEGAPKTYEADLLVQWHDGSIELAGHDCMFEGWEKAKRWAWLIKPHELAWLEDMANKHKARARG